MKHSARRVAPTIGVLAAWQVYEGTTIDGYLYPLLDGIRAAVRDLDCNLLLGCGVAPPIPRRLLMPAWPVSMSDTQFVPVGPWNTDGLLIIPNRLSVERLEFVRQLIADGHAIVFAGAPDLRPSVAVDNADGIAQALEHLVAHGHRRFAYIAGPVGQPGDSAERLAAFYEGCRRLNLDTDPRLVTFADRPDDIESGRAAMKRILAAGVPFSALLTFNDWVAIGAMETLHAAGLDTPRDVAVIGFDDRLHARVQTAPLSTVRHPTFELGYQSLRALLELMNGKWNGDSTIRIPTRLIVRQSCGCGNALALSATRATRMQENAPSLLAELARQMAIAAATEARHDTLGELENRCRRLLTAFVWDVEHDNDTRFSAALQEELHATSARAEEVYIWHAAIAVLQNESVTVPHLAVPRAQWLLNRAHLAISEQSRRQDTRALIHQMERAEQLGLMSSQLLAVLDSGQVGTILNAYLPGLGIQNVLVAMFLPEEEDVVASSRLILRSGAGAFETAPFITRRFPSPEQYPASQLFQLTILPLVIQGENVGFVAFESSDLEPCAVIMRNLAAAVQNSRLFREAAQGRRLAEEANRLKTRFLSTVSHELRTPLNMIVGLSKLILNEQAQGTPPAPQDLERIYSSAQHLGFLIRDVLDLASSDAGQLRLTREPLDLVQVIHAIVPTGEQLARDKGLAWHLELAVSAPVIWGDRTRLQQVVLNFISNAVKFTSQGSVTLAVIADSTWVEVSVSDTGLGIPLAELPLIFDEFHQSECTAARGFGGLGLGLAISKHLIEMHGGEIGVRSSGKEGDGATLYFRLPLMVTLPGAPGLMGLPPAQVILVLTNDAEKGQQLGAYLEAEGFAVVSQTLTPQGEWFAQARQAVPSAVLIDADPAVAQTGEIVQQLRQAASLQAVPLLFFTLAPEQDRGALLELNLVTKPLVPSQWVNALSAVPLGQPKKVLIVDDDADSRDLHARLVKQQLPDCELLQAHHGREALNLLEHTRPDLILLDLMMPELDGFGVLEGLQARQATREIPVIVLTARELDDADMARLNRGVVSVLEKGVLNVEETLARIANALTHVSSPGHVTKRMVRKAMVYLHAHYAEPLTREQIARHVGVSESHLANCFHQELGISPMAYLNRYRIKQARGLLVAGELNVTEVAFAVGFSDSAYFGRVFQREVGVSPGAFRRGQRKG